jgi:hypothetical protein
LTAELGDLCIQPDTAEPGGNARSQWGLNLSFTPDRVPKDLPKFFLRAAAVTPSAALELLLDVIVELADQELGHGVMISR